MSKKSKIKSNYFIDIHDRLREDTEASFWGLSPVFDTVFGRVASYVVFRSVGVDMPKYMCTAIASGARPPKYVDENPETELAEIEFLSAWNADPNLEELQVEAIAFRALLSDREYQLWLSEALTKIPMAQWDRANRKFVQSCGNLLYTIVYTVWLNAIHGRETHKAYARFTEQMTPLEHYLLSRTLRGYELDTKYVEQIQEFKESTQKHAETVLLQSHSRVHTMLNPVKAKKSYLDYKLSAAGLRYFEQAAILNNFWRISLPEPDEGSDADVVLSGGITTLTSHGLNYFDKVRASFISDWMWRGRQQMKNTEAKVEAELVAALRKDVSGLEQQLHTESNRVKVLEAALEKQIKLTEDTELKLAASKKQAMEYEVKCNASEKKLAAQIKQAEKQAEKKVVSVAPTTDVHALSAKVYDMTTTLNDTMSRLNDLYELLMAEDSVDDPYEFDNVVDDAWQDYVDEFEGRLVLYGGTCAWQERVSKWFSAHNIKVRTYRPGEDISVIKATDTIFFNVVENKHAYTVKHLVLARAAGASVRISNVNNLEQTLRIVFTNPQYRAT